MEKWIKNDVFTCPVCRRELDRSELYPDPALKRRILQFPVKCRLRVDFEEICRWNGPLIEMEAHVAVCELKNYENCKPYKNHLRWARFMLGLQRKENKDLTRENEEKDEQIRLLKEQNATGKTIDRTKTDVI